MTTTTTTTRRRKWRHQLDQTERRTQIANVQSAGRNTATVAGVATSENAKTTKKKNITTTGLDGNTGHHASGVTTEEGAESQPRAERKKQKE
jgi:hypothetical protein